jgi:hypothetical protein
MIKSSFNASVFNFNIFRNFWKHFTFINITIGLITIFVVSLIKLSGIPEYILNYTLEEIIPRDFILFCEYFTYGVIGLSLRLGIKGIVEDIIGIPLYMTMGDKNPPINSWDDWVKSRPNIRPPFIIPGLNSPAGSSSVPGPAPAPVPTPAPASAPASAPAPSPSAPVSAQAPVSTNLSGDTQTNNSRVSEKNIYKSRSNRFTKVFQRQLDEVSARIVQLEIEKNNSTSIEDIKSKKAELDLLHEQKQMLSKEIQFHLNNVMDRNSENNINKRDSDSTDPNLNKKKRDRS